MKKTHLTNFSRVEVPHLNEPVHRSGDQVLSIRRETGALHVRPPSKLHRKEITENTSS